jgi:hypothetical protein
MFRSQMLAREREKGSNLKDFDPAYFLVEDLAEQRNRQIAVCSDCVVEE